jgi:hypothetical protein
MLLERMTLHGGFNLFATHASVLGDDLGSGLDGLGSWACDGPLEIDGFTYGRFTPRSQRQSAEKRIQWLKATHGYEATAWLQLAAVLRGHGREGDATKVLVAMQNDRLERGGLSRRAFVGHWILRISISHGYRPWLAAVWGAAIIAVFALVVWQNSGMFISEGEVADGAPQPIAYAADTFLPIVDLSESGDWAPTGWMRWFDWSVILLGWTLSTIFVAGFTRIVRTQ